MQRRHFLQSSLLAAGGLFITGCTTPTPRGAGSSGPEASTAGIDSVGWRMPEEGEPHLRTWMAFGATEKI